MIVASLVTAAICLQESPAMPASTTHTNRLAGQTSPYLLQHAHNPVDWFPWGPEAFEAARAADKPIFLSIGYSTCYWCHVMERESFENEDVAAIMNEHFVCIKVDREERPDVDEIYMTATQMLNRGQGGWPMSVFLEPATLRPFLAGTYFPPADRDGMPGLTSMLTSIAGLWATRRADVLAQAERIADVVAESLSLPAPPRALGSADVDRAVASLLSASDPTHGGWPSGGRNKFPMPASLDLLIRAAWDNEAARGAALNALDRMATGGLYDQLGGGFHRYSTDPKWQVPHFEKMLYDNGQLASTYAAAYERTGDAFYARVIAGVLDWALREMNDPAGGFWSAQDAEVGAREGWNYVWTAGELTTALRESGLGDAEIALAQEVYGLTLGTNFEDPHHPEDGRRNVIFLVDRPDRLAQRLGLDQATFDERLELIRRALLAARDRRERPGTDDKVLAGWNGLMIAGLADGGRVLHEPRYVEAARRGAEFVLAGMRGGDGGLRRSYRAGRVGIAAVLEDYALVIRGLLALHRATGEETWAQQALVLASDARSRFGDASRGGWFDTLENQSDLFVRSRSVYDGAVPSGASVMVNNLLDLYEWRGDGGLLDEAVAALRSMSGPIAESPMNTAVSTLALARIASAWPDRLDPASPGAAPPAATAGEGAGALPGAGPRPVTITADVARLTLAPGQEAAFAITLAIAEGYHINAHEPGPDFLVPLEITAGGAPGIDFFVEYPAGERSLGPIADEPMRVHTGRLAIPVRLEASAGARGQPLIVITYQACTERACLAPVTMILPVEIEIAEE